MRQSAVESNKNALARRAQPALTLPLVCSQPQASSGQTVTVSKVGPPLLTNHGSIPPIHHLRVLCVVVYFVSGPDLFDSDALANHWNPREFRYFCCHLRTGTSTRCSSTARSWPSGLPSHHVNTPRALRSSSCDFLLGSFVTLTIVFRTLFEGTSREIAVYLGPWEVVGTDTRRVAWQCNYQGETLEQFRMCNMELL